MKAVGFVSLTPVQRSEVWLLQQAKSPSHMPDVLLSLVRLALQGILALAEGIYPALNVGISFPSFHNEEREHWPWIVVRMVDRGWPWLGVTDWATMEMFGTRVVDHDPFMVAGNLKRTLLDCYENNPSSVTLTEVTFGSRGSS